MSESNTTTTKAADTADTTDTPASPATSSANTGEQASFNQRARAYLIDIGIVMAFVLVCTFTLGQILPILGSLGSLVGLAYLVLRDCLPFLDGQSLGKRFLGLRAVTTEGASLSGNWQPGALRNAVLLIPIMPLVELYILFTKKDSSEALLRLGDQWANTKVITVK